VATSALSTRNNIKVLGDHGPTMVFSHGFGCDLNMWRLLTPSFARDFRIVLYDHVGSGGSDISAYDRTKYDSLQGYADDLLEVIEEASDEPVIFVGHSVSAMIGVLAAKKSSVPIRAHIMVGPSACYINDGDYIGGFARADIDGLLTTLESNYLGWSSTMAPAIMGAPSQPQLSVELTNSFCRTDPEIAKQFARVTFLSDNRRDIAALTAPTLILQCTDDLIAPRSAGEFIRSQLTRGELILIDNTGHCPHLSEPSACTDAIRKFVSKLDA
jgi:sigma-B regulation protein RsbQ